MGKIAKTCEDETLKKRARRVFGILEDWKIDSQKFKEELRLNEG